MRSLSFLAVLVLTVASCAREAPAPGKVARTPPEFAYRWPYWNPMDLNDGPFWGADYAGDVAGLQADEQVPFRGGVLLLSNRSPEETPVLWRIDADGAVLWAVDLDPALDPDYDTTTVKSLEGCKVGEHNGVESLHFRADWSYGLEVGYVYFGPDGEFGCFWLSW